MKLLILSSVPHDSDLCDRLQMWMQGSGKIIGLGSGLATNAIVDLSGLRQMMATFGGWTSDLAHRAKVLSWSKSFFVDIDFVASKNRVNARVGSIFKYPRWGISCRMKWRLLKRFLQNRASSSERVFTKMRNFRFNYSNESFVKSVIFRLRWFIVVDVTEVGKRRTIVVRAIFVHYWSWGVVVWN